MVDGAKTHGVKRVVVSVVLGVVITLAALLGLHFASIIRLPFLPTTGEIAMALMLDRVTGDGSFDVRAEATVDVAISSPDGDSNLKAEAQAEGSVRDFKRDDPYDLKVADGAFSLKANYVAARDGVQPDYLEASATFEADLTREIVKFVLSEPFAYKGSIPVDVDSLRNAPKGEFEIKSLVVEGDTATIVVSGESVMKSQAFKDVLAALGPEGSSLTSTLDDVIIKLRVDEAGDRIEASVEASLSLIPEDGSLDDTVHAAFSLASAFEKIDAADRTDVVGRGLVEASAEVSVFGRSIPVGVTFEAELACVVEGFSLDDFSEARIEGGSFSTKLNVADLIKRYLPDLGYAGTFEADLGAGELSYALTKPRAASGVIPVDVDALKFLKAEGSKANGVEVRDFDSHDGAFAFTVDGESLKESKLLAEVLPSLEETLGCSSIELGDAEVLVSADAGSGMVTVRAKCPCSFEGMSLPGVSRVDAQVDVSLAFSPAK